MRKTDRIGEVAYNNFGSKMMINKYENNKNIDVYFPEYNWTYYNVYYDKFKNGCLKCPYEPRLCGVGYLGEGQYKTKIDNVFTPQYNTWRAMITRCYGDNINVNQTYIDCFVCDEWLNYQNFAAWYDSNYYEIYGETMNLDKDILHKGNKIYSPETCVFVPHRINSLFITCDKNRGILPIGVSKHYNKYKVTCSKYIGLYNTPEEAFEQVPLYLL